MKMKDLYLLKSYHIMENLKNTGFKDFYIHEIPSIFLYMKFSGSRNFLKKFFLKNEFIPINRIKCANIYVPFLRLYFSYFIYLSVSTLFKGGSVYDES